MNNPEYGGYLIFINLQNSIIIQYGTPLCYEYHWMRRLFIELLGVPQNLTNFVFGLL